MRSGYSKLKVLVVFVGVKLFIGLAELVNNFLNIAEMRISLITFVLFSQAATQLKNDHRHFYLYYFRYLNVDVVTYFLSLAKLLRVSNLRFRNQTLIVFQLTIMNFF
jgi:hypothetical protein